jgi:histidinol-phosphate aminotransferase
MYRFYSELAGARIVEVPYRLPDMPFPFDELMKAITPRTRAVLIANPNNPTGTAADLVAIERILTKARRAVVLVDEAYFEFCGITALGRVAEAPNLFVSRTFSKVFGLAGLRLGCLFSQPRNVAYLHKAQSPYSVNTAAALAVREAIRETSSIRDYVDEVLAAREILCAALTRLGIPFVPSSANFVLARVGKRAVDLPDRLRKRGILIRDRSYEVPGCVRITVGTRKQTRTLIAALEQVW